MELEYLEVTDSKFVFVLGRSSSSSLNVNSSNAEDATRLNQQQSSVEHSYPVAPAYNNSMNRGAPYVYRTNDDVRCLWLERTISIGIVCTLGFFFTWVLAVILFEFDGNPVFKINSMLVSPLKISGSQISTNWTIGILVTNTNLQAPIFYDGFEVSVFLGNGQYLCESTFPAFEQEYSRKKTNLSIGPNACSQGLTTVMDENMRGGLVHFDIKLWVRYRHAMDKYMSWIWPGKNWKKTNVHCTNVEVWFPYNGTQGTMVGKMKRCIP